MANNKKDSELNKIYEDGLIGHIAKKVTGKEKNLDIPEVINDEPVRADSEDSQLITPNFDDNLKVRDESSSDTYKEMSINIRKTSKKQAVNKTEEKESLAEIWKELDKITISETKKSSVPKEDKTSNLLKDIKQSLDTETLETDEIEGEISDIFKPNKKLLALIWNKSFIEEDNYIKIDDKFVTYVGVWSSNISVDGNMLEKMGKSEWLGNFTIHSIYKPIETIYSKKLLTKKRKQINIEIALQREKRGAVNVDPELISSFNEIEAIIEWLISSTFKMYYYYNIIQLVDDEKDKLMNRRDQLWILLETLNYDTIHFTHLQAKIHDAFGVGWNYNKFLELNVSKRIPSLFTTDTNLAPVTNFQYKEDSNVDGIPLWIDVWTGRMICRDFWSGDNYNMIELWSSWTWKSYTMKLVCLREYNDWVRQIIIDPDWEFKDLTENIWGDYINIGSTSWDDRKLNPFDYSYPRVLIEKYGVDHVIENLEDFEESIRSEFLAFLSNLKTLISIIISNEKIPETLYSELSILLVDFFNKEWWIDDNDIKSYFQLAKTPLSMKKFYKFLEKEIEAWGKRGEVMDKIRKWIFDYWDGSWNFNQFLGDWITAINFSWDWSAFNLKNVKDPGLKTVITFIIISFIEQIFAERQSVRTRVVIDEASTFMSANIEIAWYIAKLFQRARKYYMWITLIAQWLDNLFVDFKSSEKNQNYWNTLVQNSENFIILAQKASGLKTIQDKLELNEMQEEFLQNLKREKENDHDVRWQALIITWKGVDQIQVTAEPYIHNYINTDPSTKKEK